MRRLLSFTAFLAAVVLFAGCEWKSSDGGSSWSDSYSWVNFAGVYSPANGATYVVSLHGPLTNSPASTQTTTQSIGTGDGLVASFTGTLGNLPITLGSVSVTAGTFSLTDPDGDGQLTGASGSGTINYATGSISVNFTFAPGVGQNVLVTYTYSIAGTSPNPQPGSSQPIYTLTVYQTGNQLEVTDNNGTTYSGTISGLAQGGGDKTGKTSGTVIANFSLKGSDGSSIVGTLTGQYTAPVVGDTGDTAVGATGTLSGRTMEGTYVGPGGGTGDVRGTSGTVTTTTTDTTTA